MANGEIKLEMILDSLRIILERTPQRGVDMISKLLKEANDNDAEKLLKLIQNDKSLSDLYLEGLKQGEIVKRCSWHPQYSGGKSATIVNGRNIPVVVPDDYFTRIPVEKITDGLCRECYPIALKDEGMKG